MPRLYIPELGEVIKLEEPWSFSLHEEHRNHKFGQAWGFPLAKYSDRNNMRHWDVTLAEGTLLTVRRIYVRSGVSAFSSVTFSAKKTKTQPGGTFWAKLADVNNIVFSVAEGKDQSWWVGVTEELEKGQSLRIFPPGERKSGLYVVPYTVPPTDDPPLGALLVVRSGVKAMLKRSSPVVVDHYRTRRYDAKSGFKWADIVGRVLEGPEDVLAALAHADTFKEMNK